MVYVRDYLMELRVQQVNSSGVYGNDPHPCRRPHSLVTAPPKTLPPSAKRPGLHQTEESSAAASTGHRGACTKPRLHFRSRV